MQINSLPLKTVGNGSVLVGDVGSRRRWQDSCSTNIVRVDGQRFGVYPRSEAGRQAQTRSRSSNGVRKRHDTSARHSSAQLKTGCCLRPIGLCEDSGKKRDQRRQMGLVLTALMILLFLGQLRATIAVCFRFRLSVLRLLFSNSMLGAARSTPWSLGGLALALSRLIDNSVVVLENIFRHMEMGEPAALPAKSAARKCNLPCWRRRYLPRSCSFPVLLLRSQQILCSPRWRSPWFRSVRLVRRRHDGCSAFCARFIRSNPPEHDPLGG